MSLLFSLKILFTQVLIKNKWIMYDPAYHNNLLSGMVCVGSSSTVVTESEVIMRKQSTFPLHCVLRSNLNK